jgi:ATP-dependent DNA helicase RecQ
MAAYGADGRCLMRVLQEELDYPDPQDCGRCSVCTEARFGNPPDASLVELAPAPLGRSGSAARPWTGRALGRRT